MTRTAGDGALPIGILCAIPEELRLLRDGLSGRRAVDSAPFDVMAGELDEVSVVIAEAGIGKLHAASTATALLERFACPALLVSGVAGGISDELRVGDIVIARRVVDVDYGRVTDEGHIAYRPGTLPLPHVDPDPGYELPADIVDAIHAALPDLQLAATDDVAHPRQVVLGTVATGDAFVASPRFRDAVAARWAADAVEMEGSAICCVAERYGRPWLIVRALSDRAGVDSSIDFEAFVSSAAAASAAIVRALLPLLERHLAATHPSA